MQHHCEKSARVLHVTNWASLFRAHFFSPQLGFISVFRVAKHICPDSDLLLLLFLIRARYLFFPGFLLVSQLNKHKHYTADKGDDFKIGCVVSCKCFLFNWRHFWRMNTAVLCSSLCVCVCVCSFNMSAEVNELAYIMRHRRWNERWKLHIRRTEETFAFFFPRQSPDLSLLPTSLSSASFFFSPLPFFFFFGFLTFYFLPLFFFRLVLHIPVLIRLVLRFSFKYPAAAMFRHAADEQSRQNGYRMQRMAIHNMAMILRAEEQQCMSRMVCSQPAGSVFYQQRGCPYGYKPARWLKQEERQQ